MAMRQAGRDYDDYAAVNVLMRPMQPSTDCCMHAHAGADGPAIARAGIWSGEPALPGRVPAPTSTTRLRPEHGAEDGGPVDGVECGERKECEETEHERAAHDPAVPVSGNSPKRR